MLISRQAFQAVSDAALEGRAQWRELGGSLLAVESEEQTLIAYALPTGPRADRRAMGITTDADYQNEAISAVRARHDKLEYAGDWHIHPMFMPELSGTDVATAEDILRDEAMGRETLLLVLGTVDEAGTPMVLAFRARLAAGARVRVDRLSLKVVDDDSPEVRAFTGGEGLGPLEPILNGHPRGGESDARGERAHGESDKIEADVGTLRRELRAKVRYWAHDDLLAAVVERADERAVVIFPDEYPLGAPLVFAGGLDGDVWRPIELPYGWSSLHALVDPVRTALRRSVAGSGDGKNDSPHGAGTAVRKLLRRMGSAARSLRDAFASSCVGDSGHADTRDRS